MSQHQSLRRQHQSLSDIGELVGALRNIALVEIRRIEGFVQAQHHATAIIEAAYADFVQDHAAWLQDPAAVDEVWCVIGSERGFCGDLNRQLIDATRARRPALAGRLVLVGSQLAQAWTEEGDGITTLAGARFADEVRQVLLSLIATLTPLLQGRGTAAVGLRLLYLQEQGVTERRLLPAPLPRQAQPRRSHPVRLLLPVTAYLEALLAQWLSSALTDALYIALLHENQLRLEHMEQARRRIDERLDALARRSNRARQDEITEEIEVILLTAGTERPPGKWGSRSC